MKTNFNISESEKEQILELHNVIKESLNSKLSKKRIDEQAAPQTPQLKGVDLLKAARDKGCKIAVGSVLKSASGKPTILYKVADYDSKNGYFVKGDEIYIKDDMTFDVIKNQNGVKTLSAQNKPWACAALFEKGPDPNAGDIELEKKSGTWKERKDINVTNDELAQLYEKHPKYDLYRLKTQEGKTGNYTPEQQAWIDNWVKGIDVKTGQQNEVLYKVNLTPQEAASGLFISTIAPGSETVFPKPGLTVYTTQRNLANVKTDILNNIIKDQTPNIEVCRQNVLSFYNLYNGRNSITISAREFDEAKRLVQACADRYYKKWGFIGSLKKGEGSGSLDGYIDVLRGGAGGPSPYGDDAKWKLK